MKIGKDCLGKQGDINEQIFSMQDPMPQSPEWQIDDIVYPAKLEDWHTAEGIDKRYYAGLMAFLMRDEANFDLSELASDLGIFVTNGGYFSSREISWDSNNGLITVTSPTTGEVTHFAVCPGHEAKLADKVTAVLEWHALNSMSDEELEQYGYVRCSQSWGSYTKVWFSSASEQELTIVS